MSLSNHDTNGKTIYLNVKQELELSELSLAERKELGITENRLAKLIKLAYQTLNLITFYTFNNKETRAWTIREGTKALAAAGLIHTDFAQGFIRAEVINWQRLVEAGSWHLAKEKGLVQTEGKTYIVQDGDVVLVKI